MNRFNRDFALISAAGHVLAESNDAARLEQLRAELADEGKVSTVVKSDLPRSRANKAVTWSIQERGQEWRVLHGNKIMQRFDNEAAAVAWLRQRRAA